MENYNKELMDMLQRVIDRGNPRADDLRVLCSVIFKMNERIGQLEASVVLDDKPKKD